MRKINKLTDNQRKIVDKYYGENLEDNVEVEDNSDFEEKLGNSLLMMDISDSDEPEFNINIMGIIASAEEVKQKKTTSKEYFAFILASALIMSLFSICVLILGQKFLIFFVIGIFIAMPLSIIAFGLHAVNKERVRQ